VSSIDLRSLGLFRIGAGLLLIADWFRRWPELEVFYIATGLAPPTGGRLRLSLLGPLATLRRCSWPSPPGWRSTSASRWGTAPG
jgi:hypothetical protein